MSDKKENDDDDNNKEKEEKPKFEEKPKEKKVEFKENKKNVGSGGGSSIINEEQREAYKFLVQLANEKKAKLKAEMFARELFHKNSDLEKQYPKLHKILEESKEKDRSYEEMIAQYKSKSHVETVVGDVPFWDFKEEYVKHNLVWILAGKRRTGKTYLLRQIIFNWYKKFKFFMVMSTTAFNQFWQAYIPSQFVHEGWKPQVIQALLKRQRNLIAKVCKERGIEPDEARELPEVQMVLILDDIIADKYKVRSNKYLSELFVAGRHYGITLFITTQYVNAIASDMRGNTDIFIAFNQQQLLQKESIVDNFLSFSAKEVGFKLLEQLALERRKGDDSDKEQDYLTPEKIVSVLVIQPWLNSYNPMDTLAWFAADPKDPPKGHLGLSEYWEKSKFIDKFANIQGTSNLNKMINEYIN